LHQVGDLFELNVKLGYQMLKGWESNAKERVKIGKGARVGSLNGHCYSTEHGRAGHHSYPPGTVYVG
jgi:hypothetical protein